MTASEADVSTYRWARSALLRPLGLAAVAVGGGWLVLVLVLALTHGGARTVSAIAAAVTSLLLAAACWVLLRPPGLLELSAAGYRVRHLRGVGVEAAEWAQVQSVDTRPAKGGPVILIDLSDGETSVVPLALLGARAMEAQHEMHGRLNRAFGYRRLRESTS